MAATFWIDKSWRDVGLPSPAQEAKADWRAITPARALGDSRVATIGIDPLDAQHGDTAVMVSVGSDEAIRLARALIANGVRIVVDSDDDYFRGVLPTSTRTRFVAPAAPEAQEAFRRNQLALIQLADIVTVSTPELERLHAQHSRRVMVIPNAMEPATWPPQLDPATWPSEADGGFRIGIAAGGVHAVDGAEIVREALAWASSQPGVQAVLYGPDPRRMYGVEEGRSLYAALLDEDEEGQRETFAAIETRQTRWTFSLLHLEGTPLLTRYRHNLGPFDVGLAPIGDDPVSQCRSHSKLVEYAMASAFPIYSDAPPYAEWDGPGIAVSSPDGFVNAVRWAVEHQDEVRELGREARAYALTHCTIGHTIHLWREALEPAAVLA